MTLGLVAGIGGAASAHTNSTSATCEKLSVKLTSYAGSGNRVQVTIDGTSRADTGFGESYTQTFTFADSTVAHTWKVQVTASDDPTGSKGWSFTQNGTSTPCAPPDACPYLDGTQPPGTSCTPPDKDKEYRDVRGTPDCTAHTVTVTTEKRTRTYTWNGSAWVPGEWSPWTVVDTKTQPTTPEECPSPKVTPAAPAYQPPTCTSAPTLTYADATGYHWVLSGPPEARILTAVAVGDYVLQGQTVYGPYDTEPWTTAERLQHYCNVVKLVRPELHQSPSCGVNGSIVPLVREFITFTISGGSWDNLAGGDYVITATLTAEDAEFGDAAINGWQVLDRIATITVHLNAPKTCVTPSATASPQRCVDDQSGSVAAGAITLGILPGVSYVVRDSEGAVVAPSALSALAAGTYTVTATVTDTALYELLDGNGFVGGVQTLTVLPPAVNCTAVMPIKPAVTAVDECYTADDRVDFVADNDYWTAEITDETHVTFTAKGDYVFDGDTKQVVLEYPALTDEQCPLVQEGDLGTQCVGSVPYLAYDLTLPEGYTTDDSTPLTITFENPDGEDYVVNNLPLSGKLLWPGASATEPLMWPGWDLVNGEYVNVGNDRYGWTRNGITVSFDVNPHYETTVTYPPASAKCANPPQSTPPNPPPAPPENPPTTPPTTPPGVNRPPTNPPLPNTGGPNGGLIGIGALLLLGGVALVRRTTRSG